MERLKKANLRSAEFLSKHPRDFISHYLFEPVLHGGAEDVKDVARRMQKWSALALEATGGETGDFDGRIPTRRCPQEEKVRPA